MPGSRPSAPRSVLFPIAFLAWMGAGATAPLGAQLPGEIHGQVVDLAGDRALAGIEVQLQVRGEAPRRAPSGAEGHFRFERVPAGVHRVRVRHPGFHPLDRDVEVLAGARVEIRLELTTLTLDLDTLHVLTSPLAIRRSDTEFTARIERRALEVLPTAYDPQDMVRLAPGAAPGRIWGGAADEANVYQLDGMVQTHPGTGGPLVTISPAWIEAVEVRGLGAGAEHGGFQGGIVNAVTRTGSNERTSRARASVEHGALNASNLIPTDVGRERSWRAELDVDGSGPILVDRLFWFGGVHLLREDHRAQSRLRQLDARFLPHEEERIELRGFGKLTWTPGSSDRVDLSGGLVSDRAENWGLSGFETESAAGRRTAPAWFYHGAWRRGDDRDGFLELRASGAGSRERIEPDRGLGVPSVRPYSPRDLPSPVHQNAPFRVARQPTTHSFAALLSGPIRTGPWTHRIQAGAEVTRTGWVDRRTRTGGMTWRPVSGGSVYDPEVPATWFSASRLASDWGGEVHLDAEMGSEALFLQNHLVLHPRLAVSPGLRFARWRGDLLPRGDRSRRVEAVRTDGFEPRIGVTLDPLGTNELVLKGHWGRIHQDLLAPFFDRAEGGEVFSDREVWSYRGEPFADPTTTFTQEERDLLAGSDPPEFIPTEVVRLNETGPVAPDLRQPYVDQWLVGIEKTFGPRMRAEALWIDRTSRDLIALQDLNAANNYHRYENVRVFNLDGESLGFGDGPMTLPAVYVPNDWIRQILVWLAELPLDIPIPPGFVFADTLDLSFEPDMELRNVPDARRHLRQVQLAVHGAFPSWGGSVSLVHSRLRGTANSVTGYEADTTFEDFWDVGAGPWARPNERINFGGDLPGLSALELKIAAYGELPRGFRGGLFLNAARGERFTPYFTLSMALFEYAVEDEGGNLLPLDGRLIHGVAGQRVFMQERGAATYEDRFTLDLRVERTLPVARGTWRVTADIFNVWNSGAVTEINPAVNYPQAAGFHPVLVLDPASVFGAVWGRVPPRTLRIGITTEL